MAGKLGIEKLKQVAVLLVGFGQKIESTQADGFQVADLFQFIGEFATVPELIAAKSQIVEEFKDLDASERAELNTFIENSLNLKNKKVEAIVEAGFSVAVSILDLISKIKEANAPATETTVVNAAQ